MLKRGKMILLVGWSISAIFACASSAGDTILTSRSECGPTIPEFEVVISDDKVQSVKISRSLSYYNRETLISTEENGGFAINYAEHYADGDNLSISTYFSRLEADDALASRMISQNDRISEDILEMFAEGIGFFSLLSSQNVVNQQSLDQVMSNCELDIWAY